MRVAGLLTIAFVATASVAAPAKASAASPAPDAATRALIGALKRAHRDLLLSELGRPDPASDTRVEPRIVRVLRRRGNRHYDD